MRVRKTRDVYHLQVDYGLGWEHETSELSWRDAKAQARVYRENMSYPVRIVKRRERITP